MMQMQLQYIEWFSNPHWSSNVILGRSGERYKFSADWNNRNESWAVSISQDSNIVICGIKLVLGVDLLAYVPSKFKPECVLYAETENKNIDRIDFDNMANGEVKLYHITDFAGS